MIFRALDSDGDFVFGHGQRDYLRRNRAISEDIRTALLLFLRDAFWDIDAGIDWWNLLGGKNPTAQTEILLQTRRTILSREGVVRVNSLTFDMDRTSRKLSLQYRIDTVFGVDFEDEVHVEPLAFTDALGSLLVDHEGNYLYG